MNCPGCGAAMRFDDAKGCLRCEFCGSMEVLKPGADGVAMLGTPSTFQCPACKVALEEAAIHKQQLLCCPRCRGLLVGMEAFLGLVRALREEGAYGSGEPHRFDSKDLERRFQCPACGAPMDTHPYAGPGNVVMSTCEFCQLDWFDHGALRHIVAAPDHWRENNDV